jgi:hypothetical protein
VRALVAGTALALLLTGCSGDDEERPDGSSASRGPSASATPTAGASERLLGAADEQAEPLATAEGDLPLLGTSSRVRVDVLEVRAGEESTLLRWRLASPTTEAVRTYTSALSYPLGFDTRQVALLSTEERLQPFTYVPQRDIGGAAAGCVCSDVPEEVGQEGQLMTALYPPLAEGTEQVDVVLPGVATLTGVPVTR